jgi:hypothetical protein
MTSVIGDLDNGWVSATMDNGKLIEQPKDNVQDVHLKSISQQYAESMLGHEVITCGCMAAGKITVTCDKHKSPVKLEADAYDPLSTSTPEPLPKWAPPVSRLEEEKSMLKELNKPQPIPAVSATATSPKTLDSSHKIPVNLCPASAIIAIALVIAQGHKKPGRTIYNWRKQPISLMEYMAGVERHILKSRDGEDFDEELSQLAGIPIRHDWAAMSGLAIIEDARQCGTLVDDRPPAGGAASFLKKITPAR